jgi:hypothetical protein
LKLTKKRLKVKKKKKNMSTKSESTISSLSKSPCITVDTSTRIAATPGTASPESTFISNHRTPMPPRIMDTVSPPQPLLATGTITPQTPADERSTTPISLPSMITSSSRNKSVKRHAAGRWTKEEDAKLKKAVNIMECKNWKKISDMAFGGIRSDVQCLHRWQKVLKPGLHKGPWSKEEDAIVLQYVAASGGVHAVKWSAVAKQVEGRLGKQVRERWYNHLDPLLKKGPWTPEEDVLLLQLQAKLGNRWCEIAKNITGRSENAVKNRWNSAQRKARAQRENKNKDCTVSAKKKRKPKITKSKPASCSTVSDQSVDANDGGNNSSSNNNNNKPTKKRKARTIKKKPTKKMKSEKKENKIKKMTHTQKKVAKVSSNESGLSVIADIGTALQMCEMVAANSNSPLQSPTRPVTPPTRKNDSAAHVLALSFKRISKEEEDSAEETAASALLAF